MRPTDIHQEIGMIDPGSGKESASRPPLPPFTRETAIQKVRLAEDAWNSRDLRKSQFGLHSRFSLEKSCGVCERPSGDRCFSQT